MTPGTGVAGIWGEGHGCAPSSGPVVVRGTVTPSTRFPGLPVRSLKLGFLLAILAVAAIAVLRVAQVITPADARWYGVRGVSIIAILTIAAALTGAFASRNPDDADPSDRPVP